MAYSVLPTVNPGNTIASATWGNVVKADIEFMLNGKAYASYASNTTALSTTSTTFVAADATNLSKTINVTSGRVLVIFNAISNYGVAANTGTTELFIDGVDTTIIGSQTGNATSYIAYAAVHLVSAGAHTFEIRYKSTTAAATYRLSGADFGGGVAFPLSFIVMEL